LGLHQPPLWSCLISFFLHFLPFPFSPPFVCDSWPPLNSCILHFSLPPFSSTVPPPCILRISLRPFPAKLCPHRLRTAVSTVRLGRVTSSAPASWQVISAENFAQPPTWGTTLAWAPNRTDVRFRFAVAPSNVSLFCPVCVSQLCFAFVYKISFGVGTAIALGSHWRFELQRLTGRDSVLQCDETMRR
jgi:hypothetical protein